MTVLAGTGNDVSPTTMTAPACISGVIAVGAVYDGNVGAVSFGVCTDSVTGADLVPCFSNSSTELDLLAPGALITSAGRGGGVSTYVGTSQASPHAAGAAAVLLQRDSTLSPDAIESALESSGVAITDPRNGRVTPRLDIAAALQLEPVAPLLPDVAIARRQLTFGAVRVGRRKALTLSVSNAGEAPLTVTATASRPFSVLAGRQLQVAAGGSGRIAVAFAPAARRAYRTTLTLSSNDPDERRVAVVLRGAGILR